MSLWHGDNLYDEWFLKLETSLIELYMSNDMDSFFFFFKLQQISYSLSGELYVRWEPLDQHLFI